MLRLTPLKFPFQFDERERARDSVICDHSSVSPLQMLLSWAYDVVDDDDVDDDAGGGGDGGSKCIESTSSD